MEWRTIASQPTHEVNELGQVRNKKTKYILKPSINKYGHPRLNFYVPGGGYHVRKKRYIRDMVAEAFVPNPNNLPYIRQKDGNLLNVRADNLEWTDGEGV